MTPHTKLFTTLFAAGFAACATTATDDPSSERRTQLGKADGVFGSCAESDACGSKSDGNCWCDDQCWWYGDCCDDAAEACGVDECNANSNTGCHAGNTCVAGEPHTCEDLRANCSAQDAHGVGMCMQFFGTVWNGTACVGVSGCSCEGADCDALTSLEACQASHAHCDLGCDAQDAQGQGMCEMFMGYKWNGTECAGISGCSCAGADCDSLTDLATCEAVHANCEAPAQVCGGIYYNPCPEGQFCNYGSHCGAGDQSGICEPIPDFCTQAWAPVCGCDDRTYGNTCMAHQHGVSVVSWGQCEEEPAGDSCVGHCGTQSADESCWCDSLCEYYGDCCTDKEAACA